jgi:hypothetical protein
MLCSEERRRTWEYRPLTSRSAQSGIQSEEWLLFTSLYFSMLLSSPDLLMKNLLLLPGCILGLTLFLPGASTSFSPPSDSCECATNPGVGVQASRDMIPVPGHSVPTLPVLPEVNSATPGECEEAGCPGPEPCSWNYTFEITTPPSSLAGDLDHFRHRGVDHDADFGGNTVITRTKSGVACSTTAHTFLQAKDDQDVTIAAMQWDLECKACGASQ